MRTVDELIDLYFQSVGRNSKLLLNVPPTPDGVLHATDVARLTECRVRMQKMFAVDLAAGMRRDWQLTGELTATAIVDFGRDVTATIVRMAEDITKGQHVARYVLAGESREGGWRELARGTTIGYAKLERFPPAPLNRIRLTIEEAVTPPEPLAIKVY